MLPELRPLSRLREGVNFARVGRRLFPSRLVIKVIQRVVRPLPPPELGSMMDFCWLRWQAAAALPLWIGQWWSRVPPFGSFVLFGGQSGLPSTSVGAGTICCHGIHGCYGCEI